MQLDEICICHDNNYADELGQLDNQMIVRASDTGRRRNNVLLLLVVSDLEILIHCMCTEEGTESFDTLERAFCTHNWQSNLEDDDLETTEPASISPKYCCTDNSDGSMRVTLSVYDYIIPLEKRELGTGASAPATVVINKEAIPAISQHMLYSKS